MPHTGAVVALSCSNAGLALRPEVTPSDMQVAEGTGKKLLCQFVLRESQHIGLMRL